MNYDVRTIWTMSDEAKLQELAERKERVMRDRRAALVAAIGPAFVTAEQAATAADALVPLADAVMQALEPFSGFTLTPRSQT